MTRIFSGIVVLLGALLLGGCLPKKQPTPSPTPVARPVENYNTVPVEERPYAFLTPSANGRNLTLSVVDVKKAATSAEYELEYQSGDLLQGAFGKADLASLPVTKDILLGSCSAGGKCSFHENVTGGSLILRMLGSEKYVLKNEWSFIDNAAKGTTFSSRDAKFSVEAPGFSRVKFAVVLNTPGFPKNPEQPLLSSGYAPRFSDSLSGNVTVSIRLNEDKPAQILAWDGAAWKALKTTVADKQATATGPLAQAYVAVESAQ